MATPTHSTPSLAPEGGALDLLHRYMALTAAAETTNDEDEAVRLDLEAMEVEAALMALETRSATDFAAKAIVATARGEIFPCWESSEFWTEARSLIDRAGAVEAGEDHPSKGSTDRLSPTASP